MEPGTHPEHAFVVAPPGGGRLDRAVADALGIPVARARDAILAGEVRVDGRRGRKGDRVAAGARVTARLPAGLEEGGRPEHWISGPVPQPELPLEVAYEDAALVAVSKPAGWPSHPLRSGETGTLANAVVARYPEAATAAETPREGGLCHRLDRDTSGLVLVARSRDAWLGVRDRLQRGEVEKVYLALVRGAPPDEGRCEAPLSQRGNAPPRVLAPDRDRIASVRPARTAWRTLARGAGLSLVEVRIETGVRYQIRAHFASLGFPLAGDAVYGGGDAPDALGRQFLHAWRLVFDHPIDRRRLELQGKLPADAAACLAALGLSPPGG